MKHATEDGHIFAKELKHFLRELSGTGMYSTHIKSHEGSVKKYDDSYLPFSCLLKWGFNFTHFTLV